MFKRSHNWRSAVIITTLLFSLIFLLSTHSCRGFLISLLCLLLLFFFVMASVFLGLPSSRFLACLRSSGITIESQRLDFWRDNEFIFFAFSRTHQFPTVTEVLHLLAYSVLKLLLQLTACLKNMFDMLLSMVSLSSINTSRQRFSTRIILTPWRKLALMLMCNAVMKSSVIRVKISKCHWRSSSWDCLVQYRRNGLLKSLHKPALKSFKLRSLR